MDLQISRESVEALVVCGVTLETHVARVDRGRADIELDDPVGGAGVDDRVEHLCEQQRVDDVPVEATISLATVWTSVIAIPFARREVGLPVRRREELDDRRRLGLRRSIRRPETKPWRMVFSEITCGSQNCSR